MENFGADDFSRFADFDIHTTTYKTVSGHQITADILIPSHLTTAAASSQPATPRPILLRFHGGGLIAASSLFPGFFAPWHMQLAKRHSAIIVSPNYRLLPEATLPDLLSDIEDFWHWLHSTTAFPAFLAHRTHGTIVPDLARILTAGDSAGGYLSLLLALRHGARIRAATAAYPMLDVRSPFFREPSEKSLLGFPQQPRAVIDAHLERVCGGEAPSTVVSEDPRLERAALMFAYVQHGELGRLFPAERPDLCVLEALEEGEEEGGGKTRFPRGGVFVWHARGDSVVPVEGSEKLERKVRELDPGLPFRLHVAEDGDHGFDLEASIDDEWMVEGLRPIVEAWLA